MIWDGDYEAEVVRAERIGKNIVVHLKTLEPAQIGSKLSTRHSAKGIVTQILDDKDMPHDEKGRPVEMLINPTCYDEKTEFLTKRGWVFGADLSEDDVFATMNPENFYIEWQRASRIVKEPYRGKMYRLKNQQLDLLVTPNHRMFTAPKVKGHAGTLGVLDFDRVDPKHFTDETAEEIFGQTRRYLKAGRWKGHDPLEFVISCGAKIESDPKAGWSVPSHLWAEFMGWFLSKGFTCLEENGGYVVGISQTRANPENRKRIKKLLESMGFEPTETENGYVIYHKGLYERLEPLGGANEKYIPREILDLPPQHLELFLNAFIADDGNTRWEPERGRYGTRRLSSNSKALIDDLQEICIKLGYAANIREDHRTEKSRTGHHYTMSFGPRCKAPWVNWDRTTKANQTEEWVEYDGMVYCCTVPNGFIVTRRNGVHVIAGQSVPGRMNPGQLLETAAGKIADKTGRPYFIRNFQGGVDYLKKIQDELKKHGLKDTETLYDPKTGRKLGDIMVGPHYVFQLEHQIDKKTHVRAGGYGSELFQFDAPKIYYDNDTRIPRGGGHTGAQSLGSLGIYAALAAGLKDNLREMQTLKSDQPQAREVWGALANGERIPAPKIPFVFKKFEAMLTGLGVNVEKSGSEIRLMPRSDAETRALSRGEITRPTRSIRGKDDKPEPGGLFDPNITGGPAGQHWGHIELVEAMPNPVYARAIAHTLGIKEADIPKIIEGKAKLPNGEIGAKAFRDALKSIDIDKEIKATVAALKDPRVKGTQLDKLHFKYHALKTVKDAGKRLDEAWTIKAVPVLPPVFRPQVTLPDGTIKNNPLNALYKRLGMVNESLKRGEGKVPYNNTLDARAGLYQELSNLFGTTPKGKKALDLDMRGTREDPDKTLPGIIHMLSGDQPKDGFFQDKMIEKKQDYTARATIVVDPNLSVDEIGLPKKIAIELMRPMVARRLIQARIRPDEAQKMISRKDPIAIKALEQEVQHRPVLMKRDPVLHQYGLVAQRVKLTDDPAIKVSPLILPPLGGDIDGDTVALMVPLTQEAVEEAKRIMPSQRTLSDSSGDVLFAPANESALSLYRMSIPRGKYQGVIKDKDEAEALFRANRINLNQQIHVKGVGDTTLGRLRIAEILPEKFRQEVLTKLDKPFDRKVQESILKDIAKNMPKHFVETVDGMSRLGFRMAYESGHTVGLKDIEPLREHRDKIIANTMKEVARMKARGADDTKTTEAWLQATRKIHDVYNEVLKGKPTNVSDMAPAPLGSGIKAKREQFQGLIMAPMLVEDHLGTPSKVPITKSFAEGIDVGGYFLQAAGARRGVIQKTDSVREPGYMSKLLVQANIDQPITAADCGTTQGMLMPVTHKDIVDRHLAMDVKIGDYTFNAGTVVTPDILAKAKEKGIDQLVVRSPLKCRMPHGVCSKCMGVHPSGKEYHIGENVGIVAAQALGERAAQLMLKQTHGGGIVPTAGYSVSEFSEVQRLFDAAKRGREDAALAPNNGKIVGVYQSKAGDWIIQFERGQVKTRQKPLPHIKPGVEVKRGDKLTTGDPNIHDLLATKGLDAVQSHMVDKIGTIYGREGVLRRHVELAVRSATGVVRITDPGDHDGYVRGDYVQKSVIDEINRGVLKGKEPIKYQPILLPTKMIPLRRQEDWIARLQGERLGQSLLRGIQHGHRSNVTGRHPIPALAVGVTVGAPPDARPFGTAVH
jgi:DNA-directed RNA polymerase subunit beta'